MNKIFFSIIIIELVIAIILKIFNMYYHKKMHTLNKSNNDNNIRESLLSSNISYSKYEKISQKASVSNSPVRNNGDFTDFFISHIVSEIDLPENNIMNIDYEETYE